MSVALGGVGVAGDGVEEPHVEIAIDFGLPVRVSEVIENTFDLKRTVFGSQFGSGAVRRELKAAQRNAIRLQVEGKLDLSVHGRSLLSRRLASENNILGGGI